MPEAVNHINLTLPDHVVDSHHHLWQLGRFPYAWLSPDAPPRPFGDHGPIKCDYLPEDYRRDTHSIPVVGTVHVQANCGAANPSDETRWLAELAVDHGMPQVIVGDVDLSAENAEDVLDAHMQFDAIRGMRTLAAWEPDNAWNFTNSPDLLNAPQYRAGVAALSKRGLSLDLVVLPNQLTDVADLARQFPDLSIIIDHLAMPHAGREGEFDRWLSGIVAVAAMPNTSIKLSGLWTIDRDWDPAALAPYLAATLDSFGAERVMYGSNLPIEKLMCPAVRQVEILSGLISQWSAETIAPVFATNAARIYRISRTWNH